MSVLSIQSHVVHGYVGNRCAAFCLQRLGIDVDVLNTVQLSNHTGYPTFPGQRLVGRDILELCAGLEANRLDGYSHILTGYVGTVDALDAISQVVKRLKQKNPELLYVCDPVLGDEGKLYVPEELVTVYKNAIVPLAHVLVPNAFEVKLLTGVDVHDVASAQRACRKLQSMGPSTVVITSLASTKTVVTLYASTREMQDPGHSREFKIEVPKLTGSFTGTGDIFAALTVGFLYRHPRQLDWVCEEAVSRLHAVLSHSLEAATRELPLVAAQDCLVHDVVKFHATDVTFDATS